MRLQAFRILLLGLLVACRASAGDSAKSIRATRTFQPPVIDGTLTDPIWKDASPVLDFTQFDPDEGALPTEMTSVRVLYDDHALYVGVICYDSDPAQIVQQLTRRDRTSEADRFTVIVDSYNDKKTAFVFSSNVSGVQTDGILSQDGLVYDLTWDAVWTVRTRIFLDGWSAEFAIPFSALRFSRVDSSGNIWGINFRRYISRKKETDEWVMVPRKAVTPGTYSSVSQMGNLGGLREIDPPLNLTLIPYVSGKADFHSRRVDAPATSSTTDQVGLDIKYSLSPSFTLDGTINPDFGQVEVDEAILNLTVFETRYPEKRPFFIEGSQMFTFGSSIDNGTQATGIPLALFFSRRIGKRPTGSSAVASLPDSMIVSNPQVTTILGAAKLTGRTDGGLSVGVISAVTGREEATIRDSTGSVSSVTTEPKSVYNVFRIKQEWDGGSWLGALATATAREQGLPGLSAGADWNLRLGGGEYALDGYLAGARSSRTDIGRDGLAGRLLFGRITGEHWLYVASTDFFSRTFDCNDAGFFAQPHDHGGYAQLLYREDFGSGAFRHYAFALNPELRWDWDGIRTHAKIELSADGVTTGFWSATLAYDFLPTWYDDAEQGIIGIYRHPMSQQVTAQLTSDSRKKISGTLTASYEADDRLKRTALGSLSLTLRPVGWMELVPVLLYQNTRGEETAIFSPSLGGIVTQSVGGTDYTLFGDRALDEVDLELRGTLTFTRTISLQFFSQVLIARGTYQRYRRLIGSSTFDATGVPTMSYDFDETTFNANVLLRWEFLAGSTAFLVWTQARNGDSGIFATSYQQRARETFALPHEDVLLLKISYWLPF